MIDLSIGNPSIFEKDYEFRRGSCAIHSLDINSDEFLPYNKQGCIEDLEKEIYRLHGEHHTGSNLDINANGTKIVVGHGATQILMGLLQFIAKRGIAVNLPEPYWFRMLKMAYMRNAEKYLINGLSPSTLVTLPNNPCGAKRPVMSGDYLDAVYHWPWYYSSKQQFQDYSDAVVETPLISIFSLGKLSGHCGTRLGWAQVNDSELYDFLRDYVEYDAGGVSVEAQLRGATVINWMLENKCEFKEFQAELDLRRQELLAHAPEGFMMDLRAPGMFAWLTHQDKTVSAVDAFAKLGIKVTDGVKCGGGRNQCRINLGEPDDVWNRAIDAVKGSGS